DPLRAIKEISCDPDGSWLVEDTDGGKIIGIDAQRRVLGAAADLERPGSNWVLAEPQSTLDALEHDREQLTTRLDWLAKKALLDEFCEAEGLDWQNDVSTLQSLDLAYHNVDAEASLYYGLLEAGAMETLVSDAEIEAAR